MFMTLFLLTIVVRDSLVIVFVNNCAKGNDYLIYFHCPIFTIHKMKPSLPNPPMAFLSTLKFLTIEYLTNPSP